MEDEDEYDAQDKDGDDGLPWARDRETERRKVSERQRFMRRRRACAVGRSCLAFVASEPIDDRGREASDCGSRAGARGGVEVRHREGHRVEVRDGRARGLHAERVVP